MAFAEQGRPKRVLHITDAFLPVTENWIYPQVSAVPGVVGAVLCNEGRNRASFPLPSQALFVRRPAATRLASRAGGLQRIAARIEDRFVRGLAPRRAAAWRPDLLHAHFGVCGWEALALRRQLGVPLLTSFYGYDAWLLPTKDPDWRVRFRSLFAEGEMFLVEGPAMKERLVDLGCDPGRVLVQRLGIDVDAIPFVERSFGGEINVAMVGRFVEKKGLVDGLTACALAAGRGINISVTIVGDATVGEAEGAGIRGELRKLANQPNLNGRVKFTGFLSRAETHAVLRNHNLFLCPSRHADSGDAEGGSPVVLTEAMAMGMLCIGSRHCDIPQIIRDHETGLLFDERDIAYMADLITKSAAGEFDIVKMVQEGRRHVEHYFAVRGQLQTLADVYRSCEPPPMTGANQ